MIEYYVGDTTSYAFLISNEETAVRKLSLHEDTLIHRLREEGDHLQNIPSQEQIAAYEANSYAAYQAYMEPVVSLLDSTVKELIIVPDGNLAYYPLDLLVTSKYPKVRSYGDLNYLIEAYEVHYAYSASLYFHDFTTLSTNNQYLAFAPSYEGLLADTAAVRSLGSFRDQVTPLAHNQPEVRSISKAFKGVSFLGEEALESNFKANTDEYGVLHLAMHALVDDEDPMQSKFVFAQSKDSVEDGFLHAYEIYNLRIPSKLTVLSACETGFGQLAKGEGAMSLARAFSYAGSPSVVMSHWPVDDQVTAELMPHFYEHLAEGLTKGEALRQTKLDYLKTADPARLHPFYWGSFTLMGDNGPIEIERRRVLWPYLLMIAVLFIFAGVFWRFFLHRKT